MKEGLLKEALSSAQQQMQGEATTTVSTVASVASAVTSAGATIGSALGEMFNTATLVQFTEDDLLRACCILSSAEYCFETTTQLEAKMKEKIMPSMANSISFGAELDIFQKYSFSFPLYTLFLSLGGHGGSIRVGGGKSIFEKPHF